MADDALSEREGRWRSSRRWGPLFAGFWLLFLVSPFVDAVRLATWRGYAVAVVYVVFAGAYLVLARSFRDVITRAAESSWVGTSIVVAMIALAGTAVALVGVDGLSTAPYLAVVGPIIIGRWAVLWVGAVAGSAELTFRALTGSWSDNQGLATGALAAGLAVWGFVLVLQRNSDAARGREVEAQLAVISERDRFARDLHDILGHSLTVITIKAELAGRLLESSPDRARAEVADLERLSREALADVRRAVAGYREITLAGELARARAALGSAGIAARLPVTVHGIPEDVDEVFAWTVREGVTNVLRHSGARVCTVSVTPASLVVEDDGRGFPGRPHCGHGLRGLQERAQAAGLDLAVAGGARGGVRLVVTVPSVPGPQAAADAPQWADQ